jgi:hypothetical protein
LLRPSGDVTAKTPCQSGRKIQERRRA